MRRDAVIVGINKYPNAPLNGCVADATDIAACLSLEQYGFNCRTIFDKQATRPGIVEALGELAYSPKEPGFLLFYFAGHGQVIGNHGHLVTVDGSPYDPGVSLAHLGQLMESAAASYSHVLAILDSCHSGAALTWVNSRPMEPRDLEREVHSVNESRCILAACRPEEGAMEGDGHGYFTKALLDGMLGNAVDFQGNVTVFALHEYICRAMSTESQTPVFRGDAAGTVILGQGFDPRKGPPLEEGELTKTLAKACSMVDEYYHIEQQELSDRNHRLVAGADVAARALEPRLHWFRSTEQALPDVQRNPEWVEYRARMRDHQGQLARIEVGQVLPHGKVDAHLGNGGYGHVWRLDRPGEPALAYKVFHGQELDDAVKVQRFWNGHANMRKLQHPRIVKVYEMTEAPYGFLMDAVPGENLRALYFDRRDAEQALRLLIDIADTVDHAHGRGVRHRDVKPENVIVVTETDGRLTPYLTDFDLAYHETNRTVTTNLGVGGVINYAAPEQLYKPNAAASRAATVDVYALAQVMYFVITGQDPLPDDRSKNANSLRASLNDWVDGRAAELLFSLYERSTAHRPEQRVQTAAEFTGTLVQAQAYVLAASGSDAVAEEAFCTRLGHAYAGVGGFAVVQPDHVEMSNLTQRISVIAKVRGEGPRSGTIRLELALSVTEGVALSNVVSGQAARQALNARLDRSLSRFDQVTRRRGTQGAFQTFIVLEAVPLTTQGLAFALDVLRASVSAIENW